MRIAAECRISRYKARFFDATPPPSPLLAHRIFVAIPFYQHPSSSDMRLQFILLWAAQALATTFPATVEVDLIFPRNETYAPSDIFPLVFAFQNSALAPSLDPGFDLTIWDLNSNLTYDPSLALTNTNFSGSDPKFVYTSITNLPASKYRLVWDFGAGNCSNIRGANSDRPAGGFRSNSIEFAVQSGAQQPDIAPTAAEDASCSNITNFAFNLIDTQPVGSPSLYDGRNSCAIFSDTSPFVAGNPCAVKVSSQVASSISTALAGHTETGKPNAASRGWGRDTVSAGTVGLVVLWYGAM